MRLKPGDALSENGAEEEGADECTTDRKGDSDLGHNSSPQLRALKPRIDMLVRDFSRHAIYYRPETISADTALMSIGEIT